MLLNRTNDKMMIASVVRIPMTVDSPMIALLAISAGLLNISQVLHCGLH